MVSVAAVEDGETTTTHPAPPLLLLSPPPGVVVVVVVVLLQPDVTSAPATVTVNNALTAAAGAEPPEKSIAYRRENVPSPLSANPVDGVVVVAAPGGGVKETVGTAPEETTALPKRSPTPSVTSANDPATVPATPEPVRTLPAADGAPATTVSVDGDPATTARATSRTGLRA